MHRVRAVIGIIVALAGVVWIAQGLGWLPGSGFMDGDVRWAVAGAVMAIVGVAVVASGIRRTG